LSFSNFVQKLLHKFEFCQAHCVEWFKSIHKKLVCYFWIFLQVYMNFEILHYFLGIKSIRKRFKPVAQCRAESSPRLQCMARRHATRGRPTSQLGHGLAVRSSRGGGPRRRSGPRADALTAWSPHGGHTHDGGTARLAHVLRRIRCPRNGGVSTVRAAATRLTR
jgi:hypothetical protein